MAPEHWDHESWDQELVEQHCQLVSKLLKRKLKYHLKYILLKVEKINALGNGKVPQSTLGLVKSATKMVTGCLRPIKVAIFIVRD